ncbi:MAG: hypothetical protein WDO70_08845 [Alphaproteobacteria bacterium]
MDSTCGLYSVINAIRLAASPYQHITKEDYEALYITLIKEIDRRWGARHVILDGMTAHQLAVLLHTSADWMARRRKPVLRWSKPYIRKKRIDATPALAAMKRHLKTGGSIITGVKLDDKDHWTIIQKITRSSLLLHDSCARKQVRLASCHIGIAPRKWEKPDFPRCATDFFRVVRK